MSTSTHKVLMVDDEPHVLAGYRRTIGRQYTLVCAESGQAALAILAEQGPFAVVITDMRMPTMSGIQFLERAACVVKDSAFLMLTGNADQQTAVDAINRGHIFRFLNKPCETESLAKSIADGIRHYELVTAERKLLEETLAGSVSLLLGALELANPRIAEHQAMVKKNMTWALSMLGIRSTWQFDLAASLSLLGLVTIPGVDKAEIFSEQSLSMCAMIGGELISNIPRLTSVARIIERQRERGMLPALLAASDSTSLELIGARVLCFSLDFARQERLLGSRDAALEKLIQLGEHDTRLWTPEPTTTGAAIASEKAVAKAAVPSSSAPADPALLLLDVSQLRSGMILEENVHTVGGVLLLSSGHQLSDITVMSLQNFQRAHEIKGQFRVKLATRSSISQAA